MQHNANGDTVEVVAIDTMTWLFSVFDVRTRVAIRCVNAVGGSESLKMELSVTVQSGVDDDEARAEVSPIERHRSFTVNSAAGRKGRVAASVPSQ